MRATRTGRDGGLPGCALVRTDCVDAASRAGAVGSRSSGVSRWPSRERRATVADVKLDGWNAIPRGYGVRFDVDAAPLLLRVFFRTPFLDRFAHPLMVRRGHAYLTPSPGGDRLRNPFPSGGWRLEDPAYVRPGSVTQLQERHRA